MSTTRVLLIRHGRTAWNRDRRFMGHAEVPLDELGEKQALRLPPVVRRWSPSAIYSSPLLRAVQTARPMVEQLCLPARKDHRWSEIDMGDLAGLTWDEVAGAFPEFYRSWKDCPASAVRPGGESDRQLQDRAMGALADLTSNRAGQTVVVVSHGGTIKAVLAGVLSLPLAEKWRLATDNASLTVLNETQRGWQLDLLNYTDHLRA